MAPEQPNIEASEPLALRIVEVIQQGEVEALREILDDRPELATARIRDDRGVLRTLLHIANDWPGHFPRCRETIECLVEAGAEVDAPALGGNSPETALHWAASSNDVDAVAALIAAGADVNAPGAVIAGGTPLTDARAFGKWEAARLLLAHGAAPSLMDASTLGLMDEVRRQFAEEAPSAEAVSAAFWGACQGGCREMAEYLLDRGADLNWIPPWQPETPLDMAERASAADLATRLVSLGARRSG